MIADDSIHAAKLINKYAYSQIYKEKKRYEPKKYEIKPCVGLATCVQLFAGGVCAGGDGAC